MLKTLNELAVTPWWTGVYESAEAAQYLKASRHSAGLYPRSSRTLAGWFRRWTNDGELSESAGGELPVTFSDLISMRLVAAMLVSGARWPAVHAVVRRLREDTETQYPLASRDIWRNDGWVDEVCGLIYPTATATNRAGPDFSELARKYILSEHGLTFDEESGAAVEWEVTDGIVLHPLIQSGVPCIKGTRIPVAAISGMIQGGDSAEFTAQAYRISAEDVQASCDWVSRFKSV